MKSFLLGLAALVGVAFIASPAEAKHKQQDTTVVVVQPEQAKKGHPKAHQKHQNQQMKQAVKDGRLTPQEIKRLKAERHRIAQMKQAAASDGVITPQEHRKIAKAKQRFQHHKEQAISNGNVR